VQLRERNYILTPSTSSAYLIMSYYMCNHYFQSAEICQENITRSAKRTAKRIHLCAC